MILIGEAREKLKELEEKSVQTVVTSPPYWGLRDYGVEGQLGLEKTPEEFVEKLVDIFREIKRVLNDDGTVWLNIGDSYSGSGKGPAGNIGKKHNERHLEKKHGAIIPDGLKAKDLVGIPWRVALALQADGWYLRQDIIWAKPNPMPESVKDRCTKSHEHIFLLTKKPKYYYDNEAVKEDAIWKNDNRAGKGRIHYKDGKRKGKKGNGQENFVSIKDKRNRRDVWNIATRPYKGAHFAVFPPAIPEICIKAGSRKGDVVLDPFAGSGTTLAVAKSLGRKFIGIEMNKEYKKLIEQRLKQSSDN